LHNYLEIISIWAYIEVQLHPKVISHETCDLWSLIAFIPAWYYPKITNVYLQQYYNMLPYTNTTTQGQLLQKYVALSYNYCALHFFLMRSINLWSFIFMPRIVFKLCSGQNSRMKMNINEHRLHGKTAASVVLKLLHKL